MTFLVAKTNQTTMILQQGKADNNTKHGKTEFATKINGTFFKYLSGTISPLVMMDGMLQLY